MVLWLFKHRIFFSHIKMIISLGDSLVDVFIFHSSIEILLDLGQTDFFRLAILGFRVEVELNVMSYQIL